MELGFSRLVQRNGIHLHYTLAFMGIAVSRQLSERLEEACIKAERAGSSQVFEYLDNTVNRLHPVHQSPAQHRRLSQTRQEP